MVVSISRMTKRQQTVLELIHDTDCEVVCIKDAPGNRTCYTGDELIDKRTMEKLYRNKYLEKVECEGREYYSLSEEGRGRYMLYKLGRRK